MKHVSMQSLNPKFVRQHLGSPTTSFNNLDADSDQSKDDLVQVQYPDEGGHGDYFCDISILIEAIDNYEDLQALRQVFEIKTTNYDSVKEYQATPQKASRRGPKEVGDSSRDGDSRRQSDVSLDDIHGALNGFARVIKYRQVKKEGEGPSEFELLTIEEGFFKSGMKNGYCRVFDVKNQNTECGFFRDNSPYGKYVRWD